MSPSPKASVAIVVALAAMALSVACGAPYEPLHAPPECEQEGDLRCPGSPWPTFALEDVNPMSPTAGQVVAADAFTGAVTVMSLFAGW